tara:strand:+ start:417 stop:683 length:267 start_codon:yes stop_codon:yes gene_type:complete
VREHHILTGVTCISWPNQTGWVFFGLPKERAASGKRDLACAQAGQSKQSLSFNRNAIASKQKERSAKATIHSAKHRQTPLNSFHCGFV